SSKPRYRVEAANALIANVPEPRDKLELARFSATRLGKDVLDLNEVTVTVSSDELGERTLFDKVTWSIGPGDRIGL
ncbi:ABC transporter ATP-binding protein, partial [Rhizobium ruizarguesonis]